MIKYVTLSSYHNISYLVYKSNKDIKAETSSYSKLAYVFFLQLDRLKHISHVELEHSSWLPMTYGFKQFVNSIVFKYFKKQRNALIIWTKSLMSAQRAVFNWEVVFKNWNVHFARLILVNILGLILVQHLWLTFIKY